MRRSDKECYKRRKGMRTNEEEFGKGDSTNLIYKNWSRLSKNVLIVISGSRKEIVSVIKLAVRWSKIKEKVKQ